jgi:endogenous inhibitor of DNA gyrase (YacG/DUF329 family)
VNRTKTKICPICKKEFIFYRRQKYCSKKCRLIFLQKYNKIYFPIYYLKHKKELIKNAGEYQKVHKLEHDFSSKKWVENHPKENKEIHRIYVYKRRKYDLSFRLRTYLGNRIRATLKRNPKLSTTIKLVGCSIKKLRKHLEKQFTKGMSWSNYGKWHVDHIIPCASFDLSKPNEQHKCFNYKNLQPLWAKENLEKHDKF